MSRIPIIEPENASPEVRAIYDEISAEGMPIFNVLKMFANNQNFLAGMLHFFGARWHLGFASSIQDVGFACTQAKGGAHIAAPVGRSRP